MTAKFKLGRDFCTMHLPQVSPSYVYLFGRYHVDTHTNPQIPAKTSNVIRYTTMLGNNCLAITYCHSSCQCRLGLRIKVQL